MSDDADQTMTLRLGSSTKVPATTSPVPGPEPSPGADSPPERFWAYDEFPADSDESAAEPSAGLITLGYVRAAIRRGRRFWLLTAVLGFVIGAGLFTVAPPAYQATSTLLLTHNPNEDPVSAMATDQVLAQSDAVAARAMQKLGLKETLKKFESSYTATIVTDRVLTIVFRAKTSSEGVRDLNVLTQVFLQFRDGQMEAQETAVLASLNQQITQATSQVAASGRLITRLQAQRPQTQQLKAQIAQLQTQQASAEAGLQVLIQSTRDNQAQTQVTTTTIVQGSVVLNAATPITRSKTKLPAEYALGGLIVGLVLGIVIVIVRALISDRLRRRDDIARVLGAPVRLSVVSTGRGRFRPPGRGLAAAGSRGFQQVIAYLDGEIPAKGINAASLAVVPADDPHAAAVCVAALAVARAKRGQRVIVADLTRGAAAGRLLGSRDAGVSKTSVDGAQLVVVIPASQEAVPVGPLRPAGTPAAGQRSGPHAEEIANACKSADLMLTLATVDPAVGAEHLATWASRVITLITAGQSTATRIQAVGEMVRLSGAELAGAVVIRADKSDESIGVPPPGDPADRMSRTGAGYR
jgi:capsular polysaccharide biosynthesis protein